MKPTPISATLLQKLFETHGTWRKVALIVGMSHEYCRNHGSGRYNATPRMLARLAAAFPEHAVELLRECVCKHCGKQISAERLEAARNTEFCSLECRRDWRKKMYRTLWNASKMSKIAQIPTTFHVPEWLDDQFAYDRRTVCE